jgi:hypothetical protein
MTRAIQLLLLVQPCFVGILLATFSGNRVVLCGDRCLWSDGLFSAVGRRIEVCLCRLERND